jgi:NADPH:quinone reductase-like Zn-dependent oxidoreductase
MRAIVCTRYGPPEVLQLKEVEKPSPHQNEVLIKIFATAVTASDCIVRGLDASFPYRVAMRLAIGLAKPRNPILGMVSAGEIESVGENVRRFAPGNQVYTFNISRFGTYAEYICLPEDGVIAPKPTSLTYGEAAAIPFGGMLALHFLKMGDIQNRQKVLVYGASGAVGTSAVQLAKYFGAQVTGVCSTRNLELVRSLGADKVIDYTREDVTSRGERYDLVFNAVGKRKANVQSKDILTSNGKHLTVDDGNPKLYPEDLVWLKGLVEKGQLRPVIDRCYPLEQMVEAHRYVDKGHKKGNVVITVEHL